MFTVVRNKNLLQCILNRLDPRDLCTGMLVSKRWLEIASSDQIWKKHKQRILDAFPGLFHSRAPVYKQFNERMMTDFVTDAHCLSLIKTIYAAQTPSHLDKDLLVIVGEFTCLNFGRKIVEIRPSLFYQSNIHAAQDTYNLEPIDWTNKWERDAVLTFFYDVMLNRTPASTYVSPEWYYLDCTREHGILHMPKRIKI